MAGAAALAVAGGTGDDALEPFSSVGATEADRADLTRTAIHRAPAGSVIVEGVPDQPGVPLLAQRPLVGGAPTAYVCRGFVCDRPTSTAAALAAQLT